MKKQKIVRTFPARYANATVDLQESLKQGWTVVFSNPFDCAGGLKGTEYILEKQEKEREAH